MGLDTPEVLSSVANFWTQQGLNLFNSEQRSSSLCCIYLYSCGAEKTKEKWGLLRSSINALKLISLEIFQFTKKRGKTALPLDNIFMFHIPGFFDASSIRSLSIIHHPFWIKNLNWLPLFLFTKAIKNQGQFTLWHAALCVPRNLNVAVFSAQEWVNFLKPFAMKCLSYIYKMLPSEKTEEMARWPFNKWWPCL